MSKINIALILFVLTVGVDLQIIFPEDFEPTIPVAYYGNGGQHRRPFPSFSVASLPPIQNIRPPINFDVGNINKVTADARPFVHNTMTGEEKYWSDHVNNILSQGVTRFALHMDHAIDVNQRATTVGLDRDNVVFSPLNLAGTLAVVLLGSGGRTFDEIASILGFEAGVDISGHSEIVHHMFGILLNSIKLASGTGSPQTSEVFSAGSIFVQSGYSIRPEFAAIARDVYKNDVINVDFLHEPSLAQSIINNWVNSKTRGKINSILPEPPSRASKVILASALYFNGEWNQHFFKGATKRKPFYLASGQTINVDMMYNGGEFPFYEDKQLGVKILGLPYRDSDSAITGYSLKSEATMYVLLPTGTGSNALNDLESRITPDVINSLINKMMNSTCIIAIPRMKLSSTLSLNRALQSLGLTSLFTPGAANLGLLSTGLNNESNPSTSDPIIFSRINTDDDDTNPMTPTTSNGDGTSGSTVSGKDFSGKNNYFRYKDLQGGYDIQQWDNGVYLEKIHRTIQKRHVDVSSSGKLGDNKPAEINQQTTTSSFSRSPSPSTSTTSSTPSFFNHDKNPVKVTQDKNETTQRRSKRQSRPIDAGFLRFIEAKGFPSYGLDALRNSANFVNPGLYASDVLHKVEIDITETGTVAAAATGVIIAKSGGQKILNANRPFLFFIRHDPSRLILFWGTVNKPTPFY
ncbi:leukocyte elastase inhibitor isoform X1 [Microplitis demolitor]|uniref:leukocyte elastase inhibitor isoform X1 n=1 Tax=Microplitis demolitor TaxID=69319 RepID=UPI0004CCAE48|nr:leukocyte elastase inhibitor isoform X1 [Microplitis demolitor]